MIIDHIDQVPTVGMKPQRFLLAQAQACCLAHGCAYKILYINSWFLHLIKAPSQPIPSYFLLQPSPRNLHMHLPYCQTSVTRCGIEGLFGSAFQSSLFLCSPLLPGMMKDDGTQFTDMLQMGRKHVTLHMGMGRPHTYIYIYIIYICIYIYIFGGSLEIRHPLRIALN